MEKISIDKHLNFGTLLIRILQVSNVKEPREQEENLCGTKNV
jgi:hypothetical protein